MRILIFALAILLCGPAFADGLSGPFEGGTIINPLTAPSIVVGTPTGGNKGAGSLNATTIFQNGVPLGTAAFQNIGTSGANVPLLNGINTWASLQNLDGGLATKASLLVTGSGGVSGGSRAWSGTSNAQAPITTGASPLTWTGATSVGADNLAPLGLYYNLHTTVDAHLTGGVTGVTFLMNSDGGKGGVTSTVSYLNVNTTPAGTTNDEFVAGRDWAYGIADSGGSPRHSLIGRTTVASLQAAATNWSSQAAQEIAVETIAGATVVDKAGLFVLSYAADAVQGSTTDAAITIFRQNASSTTRGWKFGLNFGARGFNPIASNGTFIGFSPTGGDTTTAANILEFSSLTSVTGNVLAAPNITISGAGALATISLTAGGGPSPLANQIQIFGATTTNTPTIKSGGSDAVVGMNFQTLTGLTGKFKFLNGNNDQQFEIDGVASAISRLSVAGAASGTNVPLDVLGTATGISIGASTATGLALGKSAGTNTALGGWTFSGSGIAMSVTNGATIGTTLATGGGTFTLASGELGLTKISASGSAPGAGTVKFDAVAGTNAGSCKVILYAGTSSTPVTIIDNVGTGC